MQTDAGLIWPKKGFLLIKTKTNTSAAFLKRLNRIILKTWSDDHHHSFSVCITCSLVITELERDYSVLRWWEHSHDKMFQKPHKFRMQKKLLESTAVSHILKERVQIKAGYCWALILFCVFSTFFLRTQIVIHFLLKSVFFYYNC